MRVLTIIFTILTCLCQASPAVSSHLPPDTTDPILQKQRDTYRQARHYLKQGRIRKFLTLLPGLKSYPLYPYLRYDYLRLTTLAGNEKEIIEFLRRYQHLHLASRLRRLFLIQLARAGKWQDFLRFYQPDNSLRLQCLWRQALLRTGHEKRAFQGMETLWTTGYSLPGVCDPVIEAWHQKGELNRKRIWLRIRLAMAYHNPRLARYLARTWLQGKDRRIALKWYRLYRRPGLAGRRGYLDHSHPQAMNILRHTMLRLASIDPETAIRLLKKIRRRRTIDDTTHQMIHARIALSLARKHAPDALHWLNTTTPAFHDKTILTWKIRLNLLYGNWHQVLKLLDKLPASEAARDKWRYWRARTLTVLGNRNEAFKLYRSLASRRSYYGFLAADRTGRQYSFEEQNLRYSSSRLKSFKKQSWIKRVRELYWHGDRLNARREWTRHTPYLNEEDAKLAVILAHQWGWHERVIHELARLKNYHDIRLRFPVLHKKLVFRLARKYQLDPSLILGVIRRESAFNIDAHSHKGAMGLMQLMPATARSIARLFRLKLSGKSELYQPRTNIRFGVRHLARLADRYGYHIPLMLAAYNAGGYRVKKWLPKNNVSADIWIESIPYRETRAYIRNILAYIVIYEYILDYDIRDRLSSLMPTVTGKQP